MFIYARSMCGVGPWGNACAQGPIEIRGDSREALGYGPVLTVDGTLSSGLLPLFPYFLRPMGLAKSLTLACKPALFCVSREFGRARYHEILKAPFPKRSGCSPAPNSPLAYGRRLFCS